MPSLSSNKRPAKLGTILLLGGTGFVGRALAQKYLDAGHQVIITTRGTIQTAKIKLLSHSFPKEKLQSYLLQNQLIFIPSADLSQSRWQKEQTWSQVFKHPNLRSAKINRVINLVSDTSGSSQQIKQANLATIEGILCLVGFLKTKSPSFLFANMGSVAEKSTITPLPPYEQAKKQLRLQLEQSRLCDYHFIAGYIKGKGEKKMTQAAPLLWQKTCLSAAWFSNFKASVIDVDDLAQIIHHILEKISLPRPRSRPIEVNVTNGELVFSQIIQHLLPPSLQTHHKALIPSWADKYFLKLYAFLAPKLWPQNQLIARLAEFARLSSLPPHLRAAQNTLLATKTAQQIQELAKMPNYQVLARQPALILLNQDHSAIYALKQRSVKQLIEVVKKSAPAT